MNLIQVHLLQLQALEAVAQRAQQAATPEAPGHGEEFGCDDRLRVRLAHELAEQALGRVRPVEFGRVEPVDAGIQSRVEGRLQIGATVGGAVVPEETVTPLPGADSQRRNPHVAFAQLHALRLCVHLNLAVFAR